MAFLNKVLVVGAGSAGLTIASFLSRAGIQVEISEINLDTTRGAALGLSSNALLPLRELGVLDEILAHSTPNLYMHVCNSAGQTVLDLKRPQPESIDFPVNVVIARSELSRILTNLAREKGIQFLLDRHIVGIVDKSTHVAVRFSDGSEDLYDAVIGADGIGSTVRRLVWGNIATQTVNEVGWRWLTPLRPSIKRGAFYLGSGTTSLGLFPLPGGLAYAFLQESAIDIFQSPPETRRRDLLDRISAQFDGPFAKDVMADLPLASAIHFTRYPALLMPGPWHKGRIVLIGDAVHAMPPHVSSGAAMAIEDGFVLAQCLISEDGWSQAMESFMTRRWPRISKVFEMAIDRVRSDDAPASTRMNEQATIEKVTELWHCLLEPI
ncbi:hypothetical protein AYM40_30535 [Paraburkholderia phytofirmans OLGA172]|uniref:FAD-binding domain-containing protein n=1 Tax=Paraburkholderia phytofirmans OLGA172 TaxID=1417228 RepID=A0A160FTM7_9BURK|nr:hypothetical protein AYM40_30535 [Paraburkholderia phytofirmans OLGA172]